MSNGKSGTVTKAPRLDAAGEAAVVAAIKRAERGNRGEVRVHLEAAAPGGDALARAEALHRALGVHRTKDGTGVLLYVAVDDRRAAVYAGAGVFGARTPPSGRASPTRWPRRRARAGSRRASSPPSTGWGRRCGRRSRGPIGAATSCPTR